MTIRKKHNIKTPSCQHETISGSFIPNGTSNSALTQYGTGFSVVRNATAGVYKVTLDEAFANFVGVTITGQFATSDTDVHLFRVGDISVANRTFHIVHLASANTTTTHPVAADISTSGTANKINFSVTVARSDVPGAGV